MADLEREIGELSGTLKYLQPALAKLEERQQESARLAAAADVRAENLRKEFDQTKSRNSEHLQGIFTRLGHLETGNGARKTQIDTLNGNVRSIVKAELGPVLGVVGRFDNRVGELEKIEAARAKREAGLWQKVWDVVKILLAAAVGAGVSALLK